VTDPSFKVWYQRQKDSKHGIADLNISYTSAEEEDFFREGFQKLPDNLNEFGFGDMHVWIKLIERTCVTLVHDTLCEI
jgi:hypothetical protein